MQGRCFVFGGGKRAENGWRGSGKKSKRAGPRAGRARKAGANGARACPPKCPTQRNTGQGEKVGSKPMRRGARTPLKKEGGRFWGSTYVKRRYGKGCGVVVGTPIMAKFVGCYSTRQCQGSAPGADGQKYRRAPPQGGGRG